MSNKAIFFDRDDTLIEDPGYINHPDQVKLLDGVAEALVELGEAICRDAVDVGQRYTGSFEN